MPALDLGDDLVRLALLVETALRRHHELRPRSAGSARRSEPGRHHGHVLTPSGPRTLTYTQAAGELERVLGRPVRYVAAGAGDAHAGMVEAGISPWLAGMLVEYGHALGAGFGDYTTTHVEEVVGRPPRSFAEFARDHAAAFAAPRQ